MDTKATDWYKKLPPSEKFIIQALCFANVEVSASTLALWISKARVRTTSGTAYKQTDISAVLGEGLKQKILTSPKKSYCLVANEFRDMIIEDIRVNKMPFEDLHLVFSEHFLCITINQYWLSEFEFVNQVALVCQAVILDFHEGIAKDSALLYKKSGSKQEPQTWPAYIDSFLSLMVLAIKLGNYSKICNEWIMLTMKSATTKFVENMSNSTELPHVIEHYAPNEPLFDSYMAVYYFYSGQFAKLDMLAQASKLSFIESIYGASRALRGDKQGAQLVFEKQLARQMAEKSTRTEIVIDNVMAIYQASLFLAADKSRHTKITKYNRDYTWPWTNVLKVYVSCFKNMGLQDALFNFRNEVVKLSYTSCWSNISRIACTHWLGETKLENDILLLKLYHQATRVSRLTYAHLEITCLLSLITKEKTFVEETINLKKELGVETCLSEFYKPGEPWELRLSLLAGLNVKAAASVAPSEERLAWLIDPKTRTIQPIVQKLQKGGSWSSGRNVALAKLRSKSVDCATEHDMRVCSHIKQNYGYYDNSYYIEPEAVIALVGHPLLFHMASPTIPMELETEEIQLVVDEKANNCTFSFSHSISQDHCTLVKETTNKYKVIVASPTASQVAAIIGESLTVPISAKDKVIDVLKHLSGTVKIQSPLVGEQTGAQRVEASTNLFVHLMPSGNGFKADVFVKPLMPHPPYMRPGEGLAKVVGHAGNASLWTERNLKLEKKKLAEALDRCPMLASQLSDDLGAFFNEPTDCLQVLSELKDASEVICVEWPRGQKLSIKTKLSFNNFNATIKKQNNWFDVQGEVRIDEKSVIDLKKMLELMELSKSRFVEIENGVYLELEKHFVKQLEYLKTVADVSTKHIKLHPLAAITSAGLFDSASTLEADKQWTTFIDNIRKTEKTTYTIPRGLDAELRPYQEEGYRWLRKMADWQTGACLADDMGLGKTLQCIALLLSRVKKGPSMVVAPASVCRNWISEVEKFTTGIQPVLLGSGDRKQVVESLEAGALLVVSYGLLATEAELLSSRSWNVMILDEAHAIKNTGTKRSQVAMSIDAQFKIAATGTPLQNHMGELWNLFQFLNPGLLGSQQSFNDRFIVPIERANSEVARRSLKDLIKPFILRRTKNQVLDELPDKTEITLAIDLSDEERTFYEALRVKALDDLQNIDKATNPGEKQLRVLAEIMKLRRACCHSSLANKNINLDSSKLQRFEELVDNLIENGHKALVFSQFVDHLAIIKQLLTKKGIEFEYLDGSTPLKEREESIRRFQAGSTDLFLISLKAGGVGLNLTAADYVIHMDPWWNPAVEDQASDRAHRIGQTKPVTIYRLVTKDTIEERIVELHKNKRDLADSLLEGTEGAARVTADELVNLLKQG